MTQTELIEKASRGERITKAEAPCSLFDAVQTNADPHDCYNCARPIVCNSDDDVVECHRCGKQWVTGCNFDDDMS